MPKTYAYFQRMNDRIPWSFALLKRKQNVCSSTVGKKFPLIKVSKLKRVQFEAKSSFEHLLTNRLSINWLLEMWLGLPKNFLR